MKKKRAILLSIGAMMMLAFSPIANAAVLPDERGDNTPGPPKWEPICNQYGQCLTK
ncbi:carbonic anhydrase [Sporosarcina luteola]|nr:carbonic anhydrase [Sporosarcina luteola]